MLKNFIANESGAVTVDWVVLTAALVGLGLAVMTVVSSGVESLSTDIDEELSTMGTQPYSFTGFTAPASGTGG
jgi:Flp pilus assembly pilin Flp